jgi:hypothetical protein
VTIWLIEQAMYALFPRFGALPGIAETGLRAFLRRMRREADALFWTGLVCGALIFAITPFLTLGIPLPAFMLSSRLRARHAERIVAHRWYWLRQAMAVVRLSAGMCWGADPSVRAHFELSPYPPDPATYRTT